jgi:hypothetical protein
LKEPIINCQSSIINPKLAGLPEAGSPAFFILLPA